MNVLLTVGYDKFVLGIEDAAKVMKILGEAEAVNFRCGNDDEGTSDCWVITRKNLEITPLTLRVAAN